MVKAKKTIAVDKSFFDNVFEPGRKKMQKQMKLSNLSQTDFTRILSKNKFSMDFNLIKKRKKNEKFGLF